MNEIIQILKDNEILAHDSFRINWPGQVSKGSLREDVSDQFVNLSRKAMDINGLSLDDFLQSHPDMKLPLGMPEQWQKCGHLRKWELFVSRYLFQMMKESAGIFDQVSIEETYKKTNLSFVSSLSHSKGLIRIAMAKKDEIQFLGIDSERIDRASLEKEALWKKISTDQDRAVLESLGELPNKRSILFSCKEAIYKFAFPFYQKYFGFHEASLKSAANDHLIFESHVLSHIGLDEIRVNFQVDEDYVHSVALLTTS